MQKITILFLILLSRFQVNGQDKFDLDEIRVSVLDSNSEYYYPKLTRDFSAAPGKFSLAKGMHIYYGQLYAAAFNPSNFKDERKEFNRLLDEETWAKAIEIGQKILAENPVDLEILSKLAYCYKKDGQRAKSTLVENQTGAIIKAILASGKGNEATPYRVIQIRDEYVVMGEKDIVGISRQTRVRTYSTIDLWTVKHPNAKDYEMLHFEVLRAY
jgi:hypothetical protein